MIPRLGYTLQVMLPLLSSIAYLVKSFVFVFLND
jgi:hypothetical protein